MAAITAVPADATGWKFVNSWGNNDHDYAEALETFTMDTTPEEVYDETSDEDIGTNTITQMVNEYLIEKLELDADEVEEDKSGITVLDAYYIEAQSLMVCVYVRNDEAIDGEDEDEEAEEEDWGDDEDE